MSTHTYVGALELASGAVLVCAVMTLWRREVRAIVTMLRLQGVSLAVVAGVLAAHQHDAGLAVTALLVLAVKGFVVPGLLRRVVRRDPGSRETAPLVNVPASLVFAAALIVLSYVVSANITALAPSVATRLVPIGVATVLVGYFMLVTRRRAVSQIVGLLLVDNGIALVTFLLTAGVPLVVELGAALDVLLVVVVLQVLAVNISSQVGASELDQLKELHD
jgi:hydrogenase-4 component E